MHKLPLLSFVLVPNCVSNCKNSESSRTCLYKKDVLVTSRWHSEYAEDMGLVMQGPPLTSSSILLLQTVSFTGLPVCLAEGACKAIPGEWPHLVPGNVIYLNRNVSLLTSGTVVWCLISSLKNSIQTRLMDANYFLSVHISLTLKWHLQLSYFIKWTLKSVKPRRESHFLLCLHPVYDQLGTLL